MKKGRYSLINTLGAIPILCKHFYRLTQSRIENILCCTSLQKCLRNMWTAPNTWAERDESSRGRGQWGARVGSRDQGQPITARWWMPGQGWVMLDFICSGSPRCKLSNPDLLWPLTVCLITFLVSQLMYSSWNLRCFKIIQKHATVHHFNCRCPCFM